MVKPFWIALVIASRWHDLRRTGDGSGSIHPDRVDSGELSFPLRDGWGKPVITRSGNGFAAQLWFSEAPLDGVSAVAQRLTSTTRSALTQIEVYRVPGQTVVQVHFRSKAKGLFIKGSQSTRVEAGGESSWAPEVPGVSYADRKLIPSFMTRSIVGALAEDRRKGRRARCELLDEMSAATDDWTAWVALAQADCFQYIGNKDRAAEITEIGSSPLGSQDGSDSGGSSFGGVARYLQSVDSPGYPTPTSVRFPDRNPGIEYSPGSENDAERKGQDGGEFIHSCTESGHSPGRDGVDGTGYSSGIDGTFLREKKPNWAIRLFQNLGLPPKTIPLTCRHCVQRLWDMLGLDSWIGRQRWPETVLHPKGLWWIRS